MLKFVKECGAQEETECKRIHSFEGMLYVQNPSSQKESKGNEVCIHIVPTTNGVSTCVPRKRNALKKKWNA